MGSSAKSSYELNLSRAKEHLDFIAGQGREFIERNLDRTIPFEPQPSDQWTIVRWGEVEPLSPMWGTYMGDVVHNLRSALNHFICVLILLNDPKHSLKDAQFPIHDIEEKWINDIERRRRVTDRRPMTNGVTEPILAAIKELQPYHLKGIAKKNSPLMKLLIASNADKHRTIHVSTPRIGDKKGSIWIEPRDCFQILRSKVAPYGTAIEKGAEVGRLRLRALGSPPPDSKVKVYLKTSLDVAFSIDGKPLVTTYTDLVEMLNEVGRIMLRLEQVAGIRAKA
jgi:hypothetical protein